ncbi:hypothetical protein EKI60_01220 [Candidatus Saccharibacteria bacterium]|nr:MAG: hypothetical protein EKI60_01220 [Candidatus Saccharibacteria bacterium]TXG76094.1 MAG: hypothetical protein E6P97_04285 [Patescibacteria group bacterium]
MIERLVYRAAPLVAVLGLGLTACGTHIDGVVGLDLLDCADGPRKNSLSLGAMREGSSFTVAQTVYVDGSDSGITDGVTVTAQSEGFYKLRVDTGTLSLDGQDFISVERGDEAVFAALESGDTVTYSEGGERYEITASGVTGQKEGSEMPQLIIDASCND